MNEVKVSGWKTGLAALGVIAIFTFGGCYLYFSFVGLEHPIGKLLGIYLYTVRELPEYCDYVRGAVRSEDLFKRNRAVAIRFDCDHLRDEFAKEIHKQIISDNSVHFGGPGRALEVIVQHRLLGAWREGTVLHMANAMNSESDPLHVDAFSSWQKKIFSQANTKLEPSDELFCYTKILQTLFTEVRIHGGPNEEASIKTRQHERFDPCGEKRK